MGVKQKVMQVFQGLNQYSSTPLFYSFAMTRAEKRFFDEKVRASRAYLEFGMGGSTLRVLQKSEAKVYSIDSSIDWINMMRKYPIIKSSENKRLFLFHVDIGLTTEWGYPANEDAKELFPRYSSHIFGLMDKAAIDTVLIDGRFRVACALKTILECTANNDLQILMHDFWDRERYHVVLNYLDEIKRIDTLGVFEIKKDVNLDAVRKDYEIYKYIPA